MLVINIKTHHLIEKLFLQNCYKKNDTKAYCKKIKKLQKMKAFLLNRNTKIH